MTWSRGFLFFLMIRRPPRSTQGRSSAASDVYKRQRHAGEVEKRLFVEPGVSVGRAELREESRKCLLPLCLLYTSPSPRDRTRSRMPSSA